VQRPYSSLAFCFTVPERLFAAHVPSFMRITLSPSRTADPDRSRPYEVIQPACARLDQDRHAVIPRVGGKAVMLERKPASLCHVNAAVHKDMTQEEAEKCR
jgi:hypothetical protein